MEQVKDLSKTTFERASGNTTPVQVGEILPIGDAKHEQGDVALDFVRQHGGVDYTAEQEKSLVRKIDWVLMPLVWSLPHTHFFFHNALESCTATRDLEPSLVTQSNTLPDVHFLRNSVHGQKRHGPGCHLRPDHGSGLGRSAVLVVLVGF